MSNILLRNVFLLLMSQMSQGTEHPSYFRVLNIIPQNRWKYNFLNLNWPCKFQIWCYWLNSKGSVKHLGFILCIPFSVWDIDRMWSSTYRLLLLSINIVILKCHFGSLEDKNYVFPCVQMITSYWGVTLPCQNKMALALWTIWCEMSNNSVHGTQVVITLGICHHISKLG